uniref:Uncharacterized protein n=1 Tax=uncultured Desulfobacterium sp. TaxID=201089 RepID=E1YEA9_9BACT|nr:unknown protein [uncultured Desulfobacterium sp.]CBX28988.1 unknown protein [uncultured Desulfobacterium sp.]
MVLQKHPNRHAGLDKPAPASFKPGASGTQWNYWFPAFAGMTKGVVSIFSFS